MKAFVLVFVLAFAAPLAAGAATPQTSPHDQLVQKIQQTYHTHFSNNGK